MRRHLGVLGFAAASILLDPAGAGAQDLTKQQFKVVGTFGNLSNFQKIEQPFWTKQVPEASKGAITAQLSSQTELNLKGTEIMRLLKLGMFDFAHAIPLYVAEDAVVEGIDLAGVARDFAMARKITDAYRPIFEEAARKSYNAKILNLYPWPAQLVYCNKPIKGLEDLKGKKVRVQGTSQGDFVEAIGGVSVTIPFPEVVPALQRGTVDCGITGTMPSFKAGWHEVVTHVLPLPVGYTITFTAANLNSWNRLDEKTRAFLTQQGKAMEDDAWRIIEAENDEGLACSTGIGACSIGNPGKLVLVKPTEADAQLRDKALNEVVLKRWAKRCGDACAKSWNESVGKLVGLTASGS